MKLVKVASMLYLCMHSSVASGGSNDSQTLGLDKLWSMVCFQGRSHGWRLTSSGEKNQRLSTTVIEMEMDEEALYVTNGGCFGGFGLGRDKGGG